MSAATSLPLALLAALVLLASCFSYTTAHVRSEDDRISSLPGLTGPMEFAQYAGFIPVNASAGANMYYWLVESSDTPPEDSPVVLWMTGGPGCSSQLALLFENGPYTVDAEGSLSRNPHSWNRKANVIFVDQPVGTGFSYLTDSGGYVRTEDQMADDMVAFLSGFFERHSALAKNDFYIFGESYAGHYVPALAYRLVRDGPLPGLPPLRGIAIGNGMTSPAVQYGGYASFAFGHGMIDSGLYSELVGVYSRCETLLRANDSRAAEVCDSILSSIRDQAGPFNQYDVTKTCHGSLCYNFEPVINYLNRKDVMAAIHADRGVKTSWEVCDGEVHEHIMRDWFISQRYPDVPTVLAAGVRVVVYVGANDFVCNLVGNSEWVRTMDWPGKDDFTAAPRKPWVLEDGSVAGYAQSARGLSLVAVMNAGHMVPHDTPAAAWDLLSRVLDDTPFHEQ